MTSPAPPPRGGAGALTAARNVTEIESNILLLTPGNSGIRRTCNVILLPTIKLSAVLRAGSFVQGAMDCVIVRPDRGGRECVEVSSPWQPDLNLGTYLTIHHA